MGIGLAMGVALLMFWRAPSAGNPVVINNTAVPPVPTLNPDWVALGATLYANNCAKCHGANLEGAPDWKKPLPDGSLPPPPHDRFGHTWHHPDTLLLNIIANGGNPAFDSKMPAFKDEL
ncbi:MAG: adhB, partial [Anaerolineales bacterium]|nr:adhB [Anaerolineales bacterium]